VKCTTFFARSLWLDSFQVSSENGYLSIGVRVCARTCLYVSQLNYISAVYQSTYSTSGSIMAIVVENRSLTIVLWLLLSQSLLFVE
jgi:hypothetical protein